MKYNFSTKSSKMIPKDENKGDFRNKNTRYSISRQKELLEEIRRSIIVGLNEINVDDTDILKEYVYNQIDTITKYYNKLLTEAEKEYVFNMIYYEINGFGPITPLLDDDKITEIMVNGPNNIYIEEEGLIKKVSHISFINDEHVIRIIERIVHPLGRNIDIANPMVDARLPDGSRVNAIIPPLALTGPTLTIRKFSKKKLSGEDFIQFEALTNEMLVFLQACIKSKLNIIISGGTGSGKTTLLNILSSYIPKRERIVTIEDAAELQLQQDHIISLETRTANVEGAGEVTIRDLVKNSLRMRPDRIIVGEVRGGEALDMLQAMNTGHAGSMTTGHANSPQDILSRLETMVLMAGNEIPMKAIREQISRAINIIIQTNRFPDGTRKVTNITEVVGYDNDQIFTQDIFRYEQVNVDEEGRVIGNFVKTNYTPKVLNKIAIHGDDLSNMF